LHGGKAPHKYERHEDGKEAIEKVPVYEFIKKVIMHIPEKTLR
jgi:hypothetical protein